MAQSLTEEFGQDIMVLVASEHIISKLLDDFAINGKSSVDTIKGRVSQAFDALAREQGICTEKLRLARERFDQVGNSVKNASVPNVQNYFSKL